MGAGFSNDLKQQLLGEIHQVGQQLGNRCLCNIGLVLPDRLAERFPRTWCLCREAGELTRSFARTHGTHGRFLPFAFGSPWKRAVRFYSYIGWRVYLFAWQNIWDTWAEFITPVGWWVPRGLYYYNLLYYYPVDIWGNQWFNDSQWFS